jgi:hypothetical protein
MVVLACNPIYLADWDRVDLNLTPVCSKTSQDPMSTKSEHCGTCLSFQAIRESESAWIVFSGQPGQKKFLRPPSQLKSLVSLLTSAMPTKARSTNRRITIQSNWGKKWELVSKIIRTKRARAYGSSGEGPIQQVQDPVPTTKAYIHFWSLTSFRILKESFGVK